MPATLEEVTREAMGLPPHLKLALAESLIESAEAARDPGAEAAWEAEIFDRVQAIDEGRVVGVSYEEVLRLAAQHLAP